VAHVNGIHSGSRPPGGLAGGWIDLCEFDPALYPIFYEVNLGRVKSSPDRTANLLWARHRMQSAKEIPIN